MGQYYFPTSLDAKEWVYSHDYQNGLKLMEHSWVQNNFVAVVENLLAQGGSWHETRLVWTGDYADEGNFLEGFDHVREYDNERNEEITHNLYSYARKYFEQVKPKNDSHNVALKFVVNHSKKQYVDITKSKKVEQWDSQWQVHPLPLLTSDGNGRGGGDYHGNNEHLVGSWAGDVISMEQIIPEGYGELVPDFYE